MELKPEPKLNISASHHCYFEFALKLVYFSIVGAGREEYEDD